MVALAKSVTVGLDTYPAGTDHSDMPVWVVDRVRNPAAWVGGTAPAASPAVARARRLDRSDLATLGRAQDALGITGAAVSVTQFGAVGDGVADDTAAIQAAIDYAAGLGGPGLGSADQALTGGTVYLPPGVYLHSGTIALRSQVRLVGASREATTLRRTANVVALSIYGADSDHRNWYASVEHLTIDGNGESATGIDLVYASQVTMYSVFVFNVPGIGMDLVEVWDSQFYSMWLQYCSGINVTEKPAVYVRSKRAASGFGSSIDSSNEIVFNNLHIEHFRAGAVRIAPGFAGYLNGPNGIYINKLKTESPFLSGSQPVVYIDPQTDRIHLHQHYAFCADLQDGGPVDVIVNRCGGMSSLRDVFIANGDVDTIDAGVRLDCQDGNAIVDNVYGSYSTDPGAAHVVVDSAFQTSISHLWANSGELLANHQQQAHSRGLALFADITTTATSAADIGELTFVDVAPGLYRVTLQGLYRSSGTGNGPRFGIGGSATVGVAQGALTMHTSATASTTTAMTAWDTTFGTNPGTAATAFQVQAWFTAEVTGIGTVAVRWNVSGAVTGTLQAGSVATLTRIG